MKSLKKRIQEGRCQGIGKEYIPLLKANEARSVGTAAMIYDPYEMRYIHTLSTVERDFYYTQRWRDDVEHICEQYLLDQKIIDELCVANQLNVKGRGFSTDFLICLKNGNYEAYSIKSTENDFNEENPKYRGNNDYTRLINRQLLEKLYWEYKGVPFSIVVKENINRVFAANVRLVMGYINELFIATEEQKLMYLIAHKYYRIPMDLEYLNPKKLLERVPFDVNHLYEIALEKKREIQKYG